MTDGPNQLIRLARMLSSALVLTVVLAGSALAQTADPAAPPSPEAQRAATDAPPTDAASIPPPSDGTTATPSDVPDFSALADPMPDITLLPKPTPTASGDAQPATVGSRNEKLDGSVAVSAGEKLPMPWETKVGVDLGVAAPSWTPQTDTLAGQAAQDHGSGWASVAMPASSIGLDSATIDARVDPNADQSKFSTSLSRSVPVVDGVSVTVHNGYAVTQSLANPGGVAAPGERVVSGDGGVRLDLPTSTAFSAGASMSSTEEKMLPSVSAEQKLFGSPFSLTGTISERAEGDTDKSIRAGFKRTW